MGDHSSPEEIKKSIRVYLIIFIALLVGTAVTVGLYYVHIPNAAATITIALVVASIKSFLVAAYFMHLISEKKVIYATLATTAFFFLALGVLTMWSMHDFPFMTTVNGK